MRLDWRSVRLLFAFRVFELGNSNTMLYLSNILSASVVVALFLADFIRTVCSVVNGGDRGLKYSIEVEKSSTIRKAKLITNIALIIALTSPLEQ
jgi:hypothetical protein